MNKSKNLNTSESQNFDREESLQQDRSRASTSDKNMTISNHDQDLLKQNEPERIPPDGGWGWFIIIGSFVTMVFGFFPVFGFSIIYSPLFTSKVSSSKIALSISLYGFIWNIFTLFIGPLIEEFGWRKVAIVGGICNSVSVIVSVFITNPDVLIFTFPVFGGIGGAIAIAVSYIVVSRYFLKRRGFALAITGVGICLSTFISPLIANYLLEFYGFRGACLLYGALVLNQCVGGALFQPIHWHEKPSQSSFIESEQNEKREKLLHNSPKQSDIQIHVAEKNYTQILPTDKILDPSLQEERKSNVTSLYSTNSYGNFEVYLETTITKSQNQNIIAGNKIIGNVCKVVKKIMALTYESILTLKFLRVQIVCIGFGCLSLGNIIFLTWIPFAITHAGFSLEMSAWCISISSVANLTGRILMIFISDRKWFNDKFVYMLSTFSIGLFIAVFSFAREINLFLFCLSCWGFAIGVSHSVTPMIFISSVGVEIFPSVYGVASLTSGIIHVTLVPVIGVIKDATSSYTFAMFFIAMIVLFGFVAWIFMPLAIKYDKLRMIKETSKEVHENI